MNNPITNFNQNNNNMLAMATTNGNDVINNINNNNYQNVRRGSGNNLVSFGVSGHHHHHGGHNKTPHNNNSNGSSLMNASLSPNSNLLLLGKHLTKSDAPPFVYRGYFFPMGLNRKERRRLLFSPEVNPDTLPQGARYVGEKMEDGIYDLMGLNKTGDLPAKSASPSARDDDLDGDGEGEDGFTSSSLPKFPRNGDGNNNNNDENNTNNNNNNATNRNEESHQSAESDETATSMAKDITIIHDD